MTIARLQGKLIKAGILSLAIALASQVSAQAQTEPKDSDSTITYTAQFFAEFSPVSVNDMISRIPGIDQALNQGRHGNRRGLGAGGNEILINGQRMTGKSNAGRDQLSRIAADQVDYIEIIRGTSEDLDVRGSGQIVNIVLLDAASRSSIAAEINMDRFRDGTLDPGGKISYSGQSGQLNYLFHIEAEPRYSNNYSNETSYNPDYSISETRSEENIRDQTEFQTSMNLGYQFDKSMVQFNVLYGTSNPPSEVERFITDFSTDTVTTSIETEDRISDNSNWELGGDYEYGFDNGGKFRFLFIVNDDKNNYTRERFAPIDGVQTKDLFLFTSGRDRERIGRTSYTFNLNPTHGFELGVEGAQTIRNSNLRYGLIDADGITSDSVGGLVPQVIDNAKSQVEEIRFESFAVHNWQINSRMSLESTLIYEVSEIEQTGDIYNKRDFSFVRPKFDYRFNITPSIQLRGTIEKQISQLSFSDFSATADNSDDDQDTQAGNPDISQEITWNYQLNLEYRLPNDIGVLSSSVYYNDIEDVIDRIDVSEAAGYLASARGNIGDGKRYGINLNASSRLSYLNLPNALITAGYSTEDSEVTDPFLGTTRRMRRNGRGFGRLSFRHDITSRNLSYGFNFNKPVNGGSGAKTIDIIDIEEDSRDAFMTTFVEMRAFGGITFRFETQNTLDSENCRVRTRYDGATVDGIIEEIENYCSGGGIKYALKIRSNF